jgi:hypothetical protein
VDGKWVIHDTVLTDGFDFFTRTPGPYRTCHPDTVAADGSPVMWSSDSFLTFPSREAARVWRSEWDAAPKRWHVVDEDGPPRLVESGCRMVRGVSVTWRGRLDNLGYETPEAAKEAYIASLREAL